MLGVTNQTIQQVNPTTLNLSTNQQSAQLLNGAASSNVSGISSTPYQTTTNSPTSTTNNITSSLLGGTSSSNSSNTGNTSTSNTYNGSSTSTDGTLGLTSSLLGNDSYNNTSENTGQTTSLVSPKNNSISSKTATQSAQQGNSNSFLKLPNTNSSSSGIQFGDTTPSSISNFDASSLGENASIPSSEDLLGTVDTSALNEYGDIGNVVGDYTPNAIDAAIPDSSTLLDTVDTSALDNLGVGAGEGASAASSATVSGLGDILGSVGGIAAPAGAGFLTGSLVGNAVGSPGGGALAGAASGAATGAAIGSILPGAGTAVGAVVGGLAGLVSGIIGGQHPTVGPDGNTSIQGWDSQTNSPKWVTGQDNGGSSSQSQQVAQSGWNDVTQILKNLGGTATGATGIDVGTFKGNFTVGNPGTGYTDSNNPTEKVSGNETANYFKNSNNAEAEFIAQQLNYIGQNGKATGLTQDQLNQLANISYQDVLDGKVPGMTATSPTNSSATQQNNTPSPTDYFAQGAKQYGTPLSTGGLPKDQGGFVEGEGGPTDDKVPARLSNTEFVIPSDVVHRLGNGDPHAGAKVLVALIDSVRGPDADKYDRPKNVEGVETPHMYLGGGLFTATGPSNAEANQEELSVGGQVWNNNNISTPTASTSKALSYASGGMHLNSASQDASYYQKGGMISSGGGGAWPNNNYAHGGEMLPNSDNLHAKMFSQGGMVEDNMENDTMTQPSLVKRHHNTSKHKAGYWAHGIAQDLGTENNAAHMYKKGGLVFDGSKPTRRGIFDQNAYAVGGAVSGANMKNNTGTAISPVGPETTYKNGGLIKRPSPRTPSNINYQP